MRPLRAPWRDPSKGVQHTVRAVLLARERDPETWASVEGLRLAVATALGAAAVLPVGLSARPHHGFCSTSRLSDLARQRLSPRICRGSLRGFGWIEDHYNRRRRRHASLGQITPLAFELQYSNQNAELQKAA